MSKLKIKIECVGDELLTPPFKYRYSKFYEAYDVYDSSNPPLAITVKGEESAALLNELAQLRAENGDLRNQLRQPKLNIETIGDDVTDFDAYLCLNPSARRIVNKLQDENAELKTRVGELVHKLEIARIYLDGD